MTSQPLKNSLTSKKAIVYTPSFVLEDRTIGEMIYDGKATRFAVFKQGEWHEASEFRSDTGEVLLPYSPKNNLVKHRIVLFPCRLGAYPTEQGEQRLLEGIQAFIHRYVDISPLFEKLCSYYVLFTWIYDDFNELPYLRVIGDAGSGKTRFLMTVGSLCYKPIFASAASTVSSLFRVLDTFRGTLLIDEGDFPQTDEKAEIVKMLNIGNVSGFPVLRSEPISGGREYSPRAYHVYGPKLIATRSLFWDRALESRCLTEEMGQRRLRHDIPINLPSTFWQEARELRNQLLAFRFFNRGQHKVAESLIDWNISPRLNQVFVPLLSIISDTQSVEDLKGVAREYQRQFISDKGMEIEGHLLEVIAEQQEQAGTLWIKEISSLFAERYGADYDRVTPKWVGGIVRRRLHLHTERTREGYVIPKSEHGKIEELLERYGLKSNGADKLPEGVNKVNL